MRALILHDCPEATKTLYTELSQLGFGVACVDSVREAMATLRPGRTDFLVLKEVIGHRHTTGVALAAEYRNPDVTAVLISQRPRYEAIELLEGVPAITAIFGPGVVDDPSPLCAVARAVSGGAEPPIILPPRQSAGRTAVASGLPSFERRRA
ncbi:MAG: hypothetical protein AAF667_05525 [Pseudomonadota bacterium]